MDVTDSKSVDDVVAQIVKDFGRLDISIHIAGGSARIAGQNARYVPLVEQEDYVIDKVLKINLYGAFWVSRAAARSSAIKAMPGRLPGMARPVLGSKPVRFCSQRRKKPAAPPPTARPGTRIFCFILKTHLGEN